MQSSISPINRQTDSAGKVLIKTLRGEKTDRIPFWFMRQAGRYLPEYREIRKNVPDFLSLCFSPELATEITLQPLRRFHMDAAILFSDILVIPHALGASVTFVPGEGPKITPVTEEAQIEALDVSRVHDVLSPVYRTVQGVSEGLSDGAALIGFCGAPWTVACYMVEGKGSREYAVAREFAARYPDRMQAIIDKLIESSLEYLGGQIEAGAEAVQLFDSWAGVLPETEFMRWVVEPAQRMTEALHARYPHIPVIGFPRAAGALILPYVEQTGVDAVGLDSTVPLKWARDVLQPKVTLQGNLDNVILLADRDRAVAETKRILDVLGEGPFVFNLGHGVIKETPIDHVAAVAETIRNWKRA